MTTNTTLHPLSGRGDLSGYLVEKDGRILRAIYPHAAVLVERVLEAPSVKRLVGEGKIQASHRSTEKIEGAALVLEHERIHPVVYPEEWNDAMFRECAELVLELNDALIDDGLVLYDVHPWNFLFKENRPQLVDIGAIQDISRHGKTWPHFDGYWKFRYLYINVLRLMYSGRSVFARGCLLQQALVTDDLIDVKSANERIWTSLVTNAKRYMPELVLRRLRRARSLYRSLKSGGSDQATKTRVAISMLRHSLQRLSRTSSRSWWTNYYASHGLQTSSVGSRSQWTQKQEHVWQLLQGCSFESAFDAGANTGWYSLLLASEGKNVISCDTDNDCMSVLHQAAKARGLALSSVVMNAMRPTPSLGVPEFQSKPVHERFCSDLVLALAVVHHLALAGRYRFEHILSALCLFTRRYLLIEFIDPADRVARALNADATSWYTLEEFTKALGKRFVILKQLPSTPTRELFLCERR